ncbi:hypothetical protein STEG23_001427 [Scotinomys teguina]
MCRLSWFLDPGGWSKTAAVELYFIFPGICTLSLSQGHGSQLNGGQLSNSVCCRSGAPALQGAFVLSPPESNLEYGSGVIYGDMTIYQ